MRFIAGRMQCCVLYFHYRTGLYMHSVLAEQFHRRFDKC